jgi:hypothetical protein
MAHHPILDSINPIIEDARFVTIDDAAIEAVIQQLDPTTLTQKDPTIEHLPSNLDDDGRIGFIIVLDALNFFFWGDPKWTIIQDGQPLGGSHGLAHALKQAVESGALKLEPTFLENLSREALGSIFAANIEIPSLDERLALLHDLGRTMREQGMMSWQSTIAGADDALDIAQTLVDRFPTIFKDEAMYEGSTIHFWKRAQLAASHTSVFHAYDRSRLTALADYKIPSVLRNLGILRYEASLADRIDHHVEIKSGSLEELEIRAHQIAAIDRATKLLQERTPSATAIQLNDVFWLMGRKKSPNDKPHHRTKTIWY